MLCPEISARFFPWYQIPGQIWLHTDPKRDPKKSLIPKKFLKNFYNFLVFRACEPVTMDAMPSSLPATRTPGTSLIKFPKEIGPQFVNKAMPWFETFWHKYHRYPKPDEIMGHFKFTLEQIQLLNIAPFWVKSCERRGIRLPDKQSLSVEQVAAISLITNFSDRRSIPAKCAALGITEEQLNGWYADAEFQRELAIRAESSFDHSFPEVQASFIKQIQKGNFQAIKFYYEITGRAVTPEQQNLKIALLKIQEAVQKHVKDPEVLAAIAAELRPVAGELQ